MAKPKKMSNAEEKLAKDRLRKKEKYAEIKKDPEKYQREKEKQKQQYLLRKEKKKILSITEMTDQQKRDQRRKWRKNSIRYYKLKEQKKLQSILENSSPDSETEAPVEIPVEIPIERDPLIKIETSETTPKTVPQRQKKNRCATSALRILLYRSIKVVSNVQKEIDKLKKEKAILRKQLYRERQLQKEVKIIQDTIENKLDQAINDIKEETIL